METNTVILELEEYNRLKDIERNIIDNSGALFYNSYDGCVLVGEMKVYTSNESNLNLIEYNNSLKRTIDTLNKDLQLVKKINKELEKRNKLELEVQKSKFKSEKQKDVEKEVIDRINKINKFRLWRK